nr:MAG TPA: hypothetical protein [Caudoviricetes sp.]
MFRQNFSNHTGAMVLYVWFTIINVYLFVV